ncbi:acetylornithine deacetylase [Haladaptatus sp. W1]|uniref:M20 family metallopeptidase n=1 Tax=Haladaptatus sp. W1 TaxID=1897478 RepID=UPI000849C394|nr:M20 family metallopeptidase [Haladaptatus sp. W1]ODR83368.1 acetylornithine deacetylase [Haladaptatus sp. W1]
MSNSTNDKLTTLIEELVSRESENPPGNEAAVAEFIYGWFEERGIEASLIPDPYPERPQVVARVGNGDPTVVLNGHIDVVPAGDRQQWDHPPYSPEVKGNTLYGRGTTDMKTGVAVAMLTAAHLHPEFEAGDLDGSVIVQAAIGEETAEPGTKTLLKQGYTGDYGIVLEPTEMRTATSEKGLAWYEFTVDGEPSHASRPDQGSNAVLHAKDFLSALSEYDTTVRERSDELVGQAYATITKFNAGTKENVLPEKATITIDRRFLPSESVEQIDDEIRQLVETAEAENGSNISWERTRTYESAAIDRDSPVARVFREQSAEKAGVPMDPWGITASTDVRNLINDADMEAITWGPSTLAQAHTYDECVDLADASTGLEILQAAVRDLCAGNLPEE